MSATTTLTCPMCGEQVEVTVTAIASGCSGCGTRITVMPDRSPLERHLREAHGEPA